MIRVIVFFILFFSMNEGFAQSEKIEQILKNAQTYCQQKNGFVKYFCKLQLPHTKDTLYHKVQLSFNRYGKKDSKMYISLDFWASAGTKEEAFFRVVRKLYKNKGYFMYADSTKYTEGYQTESKKYFRESAGLLYRFLPMIETEAFFERLRKAKKEFLETPQHYIIKTSRQEIYINKQNYQIERLIIRLPDEDGIHYEHYEITEQDYNKPAYSKDSLYIIPKSAQTLPKEEPLKPLEKNSIAPFWKLAKVDSADSLSLHDLKGKVVLLDFWYTGCPPCVAFMPKLKEIQAKFQHKPFTVVGMAEDNSKENIVNFMNRRGGIHYPTVLCPRENTEAHQVDGYPTFIIIGKDGKIKYVQTGTLLAYQRLVKTIKKELKK